MREDNEMKKFKAASVMNFGVGLLLCVAATMGPRAANAQALPTATAPGAYVAVGGSYSYFKPQYPQASLGGAGIYVDIQARRWLGIEHFRRAPISLVGSVLERIGDPVVSS